MNATREATNLQMIHLTTGAPRKEGTISLEEHGLLRRQPAAEAASLETAANALGIDTMTLGCRIARLENSLGAPLFIDRGSKLHLTAAGEAAMVYVKRILDDIESMKATGRPTGQSKDPLCSH